MSKGSFTSSLLLTLALVGFGATRGNIAHAKVIGADLTMLFTKIADVPLGEHTSRFDYQSVDPSTGHSRCRTAQTLYGL